MTKGVLICYKINHLERNLANKFCRELHGYKSKSKFGAYTYDMPGLLDTITHIAPNKATLIVREQDKQKVLKLFRTFHVRTFVRAIDLTASDRRRLK